MPNKNNSQNNFYHMTDVAKMLSISESTMKTAMIRGDFSKILPDLYFRIVNISGRYLMPKKVLDDYINQGKKPKPPRGKRALEDGDKGINWNIYVPNKYNTPINVMLANCNILRQREGLKKFSKIDFQMAMIAEFIQRHPEWHKKPE